MYLLSHHKQVQKQSWFHQKSSCKITNGGFNPQKLDCKPRVVHLNGHLFLSLEMILGENISLKKWPDVKKSRGMSNGIPVHFEPAPHSLRHKLAAFSL